MNSEAEEVKDNLKVMEDTSCKEEKTIKKTDVTVRK